MPYSFREVPQQGRTGVGHRCSCRITKAMALTGRPSARPPAVPTTDDDSNNADQLYHHSQLDKYHPDMFHGTDEDDDAGVEEGYVEDETPQLSVPRTPPRALHLAMSSPRLLSVAPSISRAGPDVILTDVSLSGFATALALLFAAALGRTRERDNVTGLSARTRRERWLKQQGPELAEARERFQQEQQRRRAETARRIREAADLAAAEERARDEKERAEAAELKAERLAWEAAMETQRKEYEEKERALQEELAARQKIQEEEARRIATERRAAEEAKRKEAEEVARREAEEKQKKEAAEKALREEEAKRRRTERWNLQHGQGLTVTTRESSLGASTEEDEEEETIFEEQEILLTANEVVTHGVRMEAAATVSMPPRNAMTRSDKFATVKVALRLTALGAGDDEAKADDDDEKEMDALASDQGPDLCREACGCAGELGQWLARRETNKNTTTTTTTKQDGVELRYWADIVGVCAEMISARVVMDIGTGFQPLRQPRRDRSVPGEIIWKTPPRGHPRSFLALLEEATLLIERGRIQEARAWVLDPLVAEAQQLLSKATTTTTSSSSSSSSSSSLSTPVRDPAGGGFDVYATADTRVVAAALVLAHFVNHVLDSRPAWQMDAPAWFEAAVDLSRDILIGICRPSLQDGSRTSIVDRHQEEEEEEGTHEMVLRVQRPEAIPTDSLLAAHRTLLNYFRADHPVMQTLGAEATRNASKNARLAAEQRQQVEASQQAEAAAKAQWATAKEATAARVAQAEANTPTPEKVWATRNVATTLAGSGQVGNARQLMETAVGQMEAYLGSDLHPGLILELEALAGIYQKKALKEWQQRAVVTRSRVIEIMVHLATEKLIAQGATTTTTTTTRRSRSSRSSSSSLQKAEEGEGEEEEEDEGAPWMPMEAVVGLGNLEQVDERVRVYAAKLVIGAVVDYTKFLDPGLESMAAAQRLGDRLLETLPDEGTKQDVWQTARAGGTVRRVALEHEQIIKVREESRLAKSREEDDLLKTVDLGPSGGLADLGRLLRGDSP